MAAGVPVAALIKGRARIGKVSEEAANRVDWLSRIMKPASTPNFWSSKNQQPVSMRNPERRLSLAGPPKRTLVPGAPSTPALATPVPAGLVVTRGRRLDRWNQEST